MIEKQKSPQQRLLGQRENGETVRYCKIDAPAYGKSCQGQRRLRGNYNAYDNPVAEIDFLNWYTDIHTNAWPACM